MARLYTQIRTLIRDNPGTVPQDLVNKYSSAHIPPKHVQKRDLRKLGPYLQ